MKILKGFGGYPNNRVQRLEYMKTLSPRCPKTLLEAFHIKLSI